MFFVNRPQWVHSSRTLWYTLFVRIFFVDIIFKWNLSNWNRFLNEKNWWDIFREHFFVEQCSRKVPRYKNFRAKQWQHINNNPTFKSHKHSKLTRFLFFKKLSYRALFQFFALTSYFIQSNWNFRENRRSEFEVLSWKKYLFWIESHN